MSKKFVNRNNDDNKWKKKEKKEADHEKEEVNKSIKLAVSKREIETEKQ